MGSVCMVTAFLFQARNGANTVWELSPSRAAHQAGKKRSLDSEMAVQRRGGIKNRAFRSSEHAQLHRNPAESRASRHRTQFIKKRRLQSQQGTGAGEEEECQV